MKVVICGSHFTPAQAVIEELKKLQGIEIVYIGRKYTMEGDKSESIESKVLPSLGIKFIPIFTGRVQRALTRYTLISLLKIPVGFLQAFYLVARESPDVTLSFGGYVAVPVVISSWLLSVPIIIHEQTLVMGLANAVSSLFADKVALTFKGRQFSPSQKYMVTGNPIRESLLAVNTHLSKEIESFLGDARKRGKPLLLITGGSQGSHILNEMILKNLERLLSMVSVIHQTGDSKYKDFEKLEFKKSQLNLSEGYLVRKWFDAEDFGVLLGAVDLAVSRAGANTLMEFAYRGVPALVIPIPYLYKDEQVENAHFFEDLGLVKMLPQSKLTDQSFLSSIKGMLGNLVNLRSVAKKANKIIIPDSAKRLALETILLASVR